MSLRNCFLSYHHEKDQSYIKLLRDEINPKFVDRSLKEDISHQADTSIYKTIRGKMYNCSITIVLIGSETGHREWIDKEMWASLRSYRSEAKTFKPNGLLGIYLPFCSHSVPYLLEENIKTGYAVTMHWNSVRQNLNAKIEEAYHKRQDAWRLMLTGSRPF